MKKMMNVIIVTVLMMSAVGAMAQPGSNGKQDMRMENMTPEEQAKKRAERLKEELALSESQAAEIYTISLAHATEMQKLRAEQKALREKVKSEREATRDKIKAVLTAEQIVKFDQMAEEQKQKQQEKRAGGDEE